MVSKDKKQGVVEAPNASDKISRKQFEEELGKLQVELRTLSTITATTAAGYAA